MLTTLTLLPVLATALAWWLMPTFEPSSPRRLATAAVLLLGLTGSPTPVHPRPAPAAWRPACSNT